MGDTPLPKSDEHLYRNADLDETAAVVTRKAAVLLPLVEIDTAWHLLFIRRAEHPDDRHSGQVAFPGGASEPGDRDAQATALRETHEEIGIESASISVIGTLDTYVTSSRYEVTPVVGCMRWPAPLDPAPEEVARVFTIPLQWLADRDNLEIRNRTVRRDNIPKKPHPVLYFKRYDGETLWGASARMTVNLLRDIDQQRIVLPSG